jgi:hypothetical protein
MFFQAWLPLNTHNLHISVPVDMLDDMDGHPGFPTATPCTRLLADSSRC